MNASVIWIIIAIVAITLLCMYIDYVFEFIKHFFRFLGISLGLLCETINEAGEDIENEFYKENKKGKKGKKGETDIPEKKNLWRFFWTRLLGLLVVVTTIFAVVMIVMYFAAPETCKSILSEIWEFIKSVGTSIGDFASNIISKIKNKQSAP